MEKYKNWKALVFENEPLPIIEFGKDNFENSISLEECKKNMISTMLLYSMKCYPKR